MSSLKHSFSFDALDRSEGSGSSDWQDEQMDVNSRVHPNDWTTAHTTFRVSDAPQEKRERFQSLKRAHDGYGEEDRKSTLRQSKIMKDAECFSNVCSLSEQETEKVFKIIKTSDISSNTFGGKSYEKILLAVMTLVRDQNINSTEQMNQRLILQDNFKELMNSCKIGSGELRRVRQMVREKTEYFNGA